MRQHPIAIFAAILSQSFISVAFAAEAPPAAGSAVAKIGEKMPPMDTVPPTFADVAYGPGTGQRLWFWQAKSDKPTPLIMNIHGGGWMHGPREVFSHGDHRYLEQGISVAHITIRSRRPSRCPLPCWMPPVRFNSSGARRRSGTLTPSA